MTSSIMMTSDCCCFFFLSKKLDFVRYSLAKFDDGMSSLSKAMLK